MIKKKTPVKNKGFSHLDENGRVSMVDVSGKKRTERTAIAAITISFEKSVFSKIIAEGVSKGDVLCIAKTAGIMAAKKTSELIPLCHPVFLSNCDIKFHADEKKCSIDIYSRARTTDLTGVEMEAIIAAQIAAATVYDMCKALSKKIKISDLSLLYKSGGKSGVFKNEDAPAEKFKCVSEWIK